MIRVGQQNGHILLPVVLAITLVATVAFMMNYDSAIEAGISRVNRNQIESAM